MHSPEHKTVLVKHRDDGRSHARDLTCPCSPALSCVACEIMVTVMEALDGERVHSIPTRTYEAEAA